MKGLSSQSAGSSEKPVHEYLDISGNIIQTDIAVTHKKTNNAPSDRNVAINKKLLADGKELSARGLYYYTRELKDNGGIWRRQTALTVFSMQSAAGRKITLQPSGNSPHVRT